ncbi:MAG: DNA polymerase domain-containing protein [Trueperaceae bacterium]
MTLDPWLFGWDTTPCIVSVWAERSGKALMWRRIGDKVICGREQYRPWLYAAHLEDVSSLGANLHCDDTTAPFSYQELPGSSHSLNYLPLKYLLSAKDGRSLEQLLRTNASMRLGKDVTNLNSLEDYYQVPPVEQYLMQTGRVYFHELKFADLHRLQFDLETTSLSAEHGRIFMIAVRDSKGLEIVLEAPRLQDEATMIIELCQLIQERDPDVIENHNLMGFDLPFLEGRAQVHKLNLELGRKPGPLGLIRMGDSGETQSRRGSVRYSVAGRELLDTLDATWRVDFVVRRMPSHGLKDVAKFFGVASEERVYLEGAKIFETYQHDPQRVRRYALQDVAEVDAIAQRLHTSTFAMTKMAPRRYEKVAYAGTATGILEPLLVRAYLHSKTALPEAVAATSHEPHAGGAVMLFATGVARRVVKADIASLYPSLIRLYTIAPKCDSLGVFVHLVDLLTTLRLEHKTAAKHAEPGSLEYGEHEAMQAAMKLLINSAYGYLGAEKIAWFADRAAADEITQRGREVLQHVCHELKARGATLIEADTDGVYFCVPDAWDEARERALVEEVAATLPNGLRLEFDGRYRAMFSHEIKNYALLSYDGVLTVRGGALHSSRAEPFAERWLKEALKYLLEQNLQALRESFLATITNLKTRHYNVADVAIKVRLTKTPEQYAKSKRKEAAYEALLASNTSRWRQGERVKIYKARQGWRVFDEGQSNHDDYDVHHYVKTLYVSYIERFKKAFSNEDFQSIFRLEQEGLFDTPLHDLKTLMIRTES